ncbi:uncharacterized protein DUF2516 [Haloactinopolyspora alba]|uniref:Uncharacterized protein DUF2516 n=1 Tax=Haloactinopolyspora alba TaxID=648780 RepID=A0A2P8DK40_9ACTN|nr:DUF2516 family protein [Haloactinopolyspora alba]PSK97541.1 uncharacterized protein DUF2516 [Haloactinopolyspora alba]
MFGDFQSWLLILLGVAALALKGYAFIDAIRVPTQAFPAAGKLTKPIWMGILGVAVLVEIAVFPAPLFLVNLLGVVGAAVYLVDVRPAVRAVGGGSRGSSTRDGPYGPW